MNKPIKYGSSWKSSVVLAANTPQEVFSAAANARGAYIWRAGSADYWNNTNSRCALIAAAVAPASVVGGDVLMLACSFSQEATAFQQAAILENPIFIPAGKGLWFIAETLQTGAVMRHVLYDLL